jgi:GNAT superfamily N-acetyltransferase
MKTRLARKRDFDGIKQIFELAFTEEYQRREVNIVRRIEKIESIYPLVRMLSLFPNPYQHVFTVHVLEEDGKIAGMAQMSPRNDSQTRWHVDNIAVHPDFRGKGIAQQLLTDVFGYYGERGAHRFTLEVDTENAPAIKLYEKLGFRRFSTLYYHKMSPKQLGKYRDLGEVSVHPGLRERRPSDTEAVWELYQQSIPPYIRVVEDRSPSDFSLSPVQQGTEWLKRSLKRSQAIHWVVEDSHRQCLAAAIDIYAQMRELPHVIQLSLHPAYSDLAEPLLTFALNQLANVSINPVLIGSYECHRAKQDAIKALGFKKLTADFLMVRDNMEKLVLPSTAEAQVLKSMNLADG